MYPNQGYNGHRLGYHRLYVGFGRARTLGGQAMFSIRCHSVKFLVVSVLVLGLLVLLALNGSYAQESPATIQEIPKTTIVEPHAHVQIETIENTLESNTDQLDSLQRQIDELHNRFDDLLGIGQGVIAAVTGIAFLAMVINVGLFMAVFIYERKRITKLSKETSDIQKKIDEFTKINQNDIEFAQYKIAFNSARFFAGVESYEFAFDEIITAASHVLKSNRDNLIYKCTDVLNNIITLKGYNINDEQRSDLQKLRDELKDNWPEEFEIVSNILKSGT